MKPVLSLMEIPVSLDPAAISLSLQLPSLLTPSLGADAITEDKGFIYRLCIKKRRHYHHHDMYQH